MYYNNNYHFSRPNYGYAYGNPYRLNFSRGYPRVVVYNGPQNFNKLTDALHKAGKFLKKDWEETKRDLRAGAALPILLSGVPGYLGGQVIAPYVDPDHGSTHSEAKIIEPIFTHSEDGVPTVTYQEIWPEYALNLVEIPNVKDFYRRGLGKRRWYNDAMLDSKGNLVWGVRKEIRDLNPEYWKKKLELGELARQPAINFFENQKKQ